jgi:Ankyrin repeats (3 copies)
MGNDCSVPERVYQAVKLGSVNKLQELCAQLEQSGQLSAGSQALEWKDADGRTPLLLAASKDQFPLVQLLLQSGADLTYMRHGKGGTALHEAVSNNAEHVAQLLLQRGADPFVENFKSKTAADIAVKRTNLNMLRMMESHALYIGTIRVKVWCGMWYDGPELVFCFCVIG